MKIETPMSTTMDIMIRRSRYAVTGGSSLQAGACLPVYHRETGQSS
jgi:hypothetical protein